MAKEIPKEKEKFISLKEATKYCDYSQEYLSLRARQGKLKSIKIGRNWHTTIEWLNEYLDNIENYNNNGTSKNKHNHRNAIKKENQLNSGIKKPKTRIKIAKVALTVLFLLLFSGGFVFGYPFFGKYLKPIVSDVSSNISDGAKYIASISRASLDDFSKKFESDLSLVVSDANDLFGFVKNKSNDLAKTGKGIFVFPKKAIDKFLIERNSLTGNTFQTIGKKINNLLETAYNYAKTGYEVVFYPWRKEKEKMLFGEIRKFAKKEDLAKLEKDIKELEKKGVLNKEAAQKEKPIVVIRRIKEIINKEGEYNSKEIQSIKKDIENIKKWRSDIDNLQAISNKLSSGPPNSQITTAPIYIGSSGLQVSGNGVFSSLAVSGEAGIMNLGVGNSATIGNNSSDKLVVHGTSSFTAPATFSEEVKVGNNSNYLLFKPNGDLTATGNVGIGGNTDIGGNLSISGSQDLSGPLSITASTTSPIITANQTGTGPISKFQRAGNTVFEINNSGQQVITSTSTPQLKVRYDNSNFLAVAVSSLGNTSLSSTKGISFYGNATSTWQVDNAPLNLKTIGAGDMSFLSAGDLYLKTSTSTSDIIVAPASIERIRVVASSGYVGVATSTPQYPFSVWETMAVGTSTVPLLIADTSANNVGIGVSSPTAKLEIKGNGTSTSPALAIINSASQPLLYVENNGNIGIGTTNPTEKLYLVGNSYTEGNATTTGSIYIGSNMLVSGNATTSGNAYIGGQSTLNGTTTASSIYPASDETYYLGSSAKKWLHIYTKDLTATNLYVSGTTTISGTASNDFTINTDNSSADAEDVSLIFERGSVTPNAIIYWDSGQKRFNFNQDVYLENNATTSGNAYIGGQLNVSGSSNLATTTISKILTISSGGASIYGPLSQSGGNVSIATTTIAGNLTVSNLLDINGTGVNDIAGTLNLSGGALTSSGALTITPASGSNLNIALSGTGDLAVNTNQLYVDTSSGNVGIATSTPGVTYGEKLTVAGAGYFTSDLYVGGEMNVTGTTTFSGHLLPSQNDTYDLGSADKRWRNLYLGADTIHIGSSVTDEYAISYNTSDNYLGFNANGSGNPEIVFDSSGNVGIGTASPSHKLEINFGTNVGVAISNDFGGGPLPDNATGVLGGIGFSRSSDGIYTDLIFAEDNGADLGIKARSDIHFYANNDDTVIIKENGNVGIGTTSPGEKLEITNGRIRVGTGSDYSILEGGTGYGSHLALRYADGVINTYLSGNGNSYLNVNHGYVGIGTTSPGAKLEVNGNIYVHPTLSGRAQINFGFTNGVIRSGKDYSGSGSDTIELYNNGLGVAVKYGGNVGIGTTNPSRKLQVSGGAMRMDSAQQIEWGGSNNYIYGNSTTNILAFHTNGSEQVRIDNNGNVGIGTANPAAKLEIKQSGTDPYLILRTSGGVEWLRIANGDAPPGYIGIGTIAPVNPIDWRFNAGNPDFQITNQGNVGIGTVSPKNKLDIEGGLAVGSSYSGSYTAPSNGAIIQGNVGIGTANPSRKLVVHSSSNTWTLSDTSGTSHYVVQEYTTPTATGYIGVEGPTGGGIFVGSLGDATVVGSKTADPLQFGTGQTVKMTILSNGNVGIGTTNPGYKLDVLGDSTGGDIARIGTGPLAGDQVLRFTSDASRTYLGLQAETGTKSSTRPLVLNPDGGNVGIGTTSPSYDLDLGNGEIGNVVKLWSYNNGAGDLILNVNDLHINLDSNNDQGGRQFTISKDQTDGTVGGNTLFYINEAGNVGIGTNAPKNKLDIEGGLAVGSSYSGSYTAPSNGAIIQGNVGIGTTGPNYKLQVVGGSVATDGSYYLKRTSSNSYIGVISATTNRGANTVTLKDLNGNVVIDLFGNEAYFGSGSNTGVWKDNGNVGIGTTSPRGILDVVSENKISYFENTNPNNSPVMMIQDSAGGGLQNEDRGLVINVTGASTNVKSFHIYDGSTSRFVVQQNGNVGIGTANPSQKLTIQGNGSQEIQNVLGVFNPVSGISAQGNGAAIIMGMSSSQYYAKIATVFEGKNPGYLRPALAFYTMDSSYLPGSEIERMRIASSGNVGIGTVTPKNKLDIEGGLAVGSSYSGSYTAPSNGAIIQGNVGIGTTGPDYTLDVAGNFRATGGLTIDSTNYWNTGGVLRLNNPGGEAKLGIGNYLAEASGGSYGYIQIHASHETGSKILLEGKQGGHNIMFDNTGWQFGITGGNVGIGTASPSGSLHVVAPANVQAGIFETPAGAGGYDIVEMKRGSTVTFGFRDSSGISQMVIPSTHGFRLYKDGSYSNPYLSILNNGNVGIGTTAPGAKLHIVGDNGAAKRSLIIDSDSDADDVPFRIRANATPSSASDSDTKFIVTGNGMVGIGLVNPGELLSVAGDVIIGDSTWAAGSGAVGADLLVQGNVGIGTTNPTQKLDVNGNIYSRGALIAASGGVTIWGDAPNRYIRTGSGETLQITSGNVATNGIYIDNNGNVGIGTTNPSGSANRNLHIADGSSAGLTLERTSATTGKYSLFAMSSGDFGIYDELNSVYRFNILKNGNVGIGTVSPGSRLEVKGSTSDNTASGLNVTNSGGTSLLYVRNDGNVGIGTASPGAKLSVETANGNTIIQSWSRKDSGITWYNNLAGGDWRLWDTTGDSILLGVTSGDASSDNNVGVGVPGTALNAKLQVRGSTSDNTAFAFKAENSGGTSLLAVRNDGNVGIGTVSPKNKLDIEGGLAVGSSYSGSYTAPSNGAIIQGNVGIGTTSPEGTLHVMTGSAGSVTPDPDMDDLVVENSGKGGISILTPDTSNSFLTFGSPSLAYGAYLRWNYNTSQLAIRARGDNPHISFIPGDTEKVRIDNNGNVGIGTTSPNGLLHLESGDVIVRMVEKGATSDEGKWYWRFNENKADFGTNNDAVNNGNSIFTISRNGFNIDTLSLVKDTGSVAIGASDAGTAGLAIMNGNVGIGTTSPSSKLSVLNSGNSLLLLQNTAGTGVDITLADTSWSAHIIQDTGDIKFQTGGIQDALMIKRNGNVGIGTTNPGAKLHVSGGGILLDNGYTIDALKTDGVTRQTLLQFSPGNNTWLKSSGYIALFSGNSEAMRIENGNVGIGTANPGAGLEVSSSSAGLGNTIKIGREGIDYGKINSDAGLYINIDADNDSTNRFFAITHDTDLSGGGYAPGDLELFRVQENGNVGIGTTNPAYGKLQIGDSASNNAENISLKGWVGLDLGQAAGSWRSILGHNIKVDPSGQFVVSASHSSFGYRAITFDYSSINTGIQFYTYHGNVTAGDPLLHERMRITNSGNVGIGTVSPGAKLSVNGGVLVGTNYSTSTLGSGASMAIEGNVGIGTTGPTHTLEVNGNSDFEGTMYFNTKPSGQAGGLISWGSTAFYIKAQNNANLLISDDSNNGIYIKDGGNVGIGTVSPGAKLEVSSSGETELKISSNTNAAGGDVDAKLVLRNYDTDRWAIGNDVDDGNNLYFRRADTGNQYLTVSYSTGNVGIGTNAPTSRLQVKGDGTNPILSLLDGSGTDEVTVLNNGNVGIGTTSPASPLHVYENTSVTTQGAGLTIEQAGTGDAIAQFLIPGSKRWVMGIDNSDSDKFKIASNVDLDTEARLTIDTNGNVGIGTNAPTSRLQVKGDGTNPILSLLDGSGTDEVTVLNNGNVGIGTANPGTKLEVSGNIANSIGSGGTLTLYDNNLTRKNRILLGADDLGAYIRGDFGSGGTSKIRFQNTAGITAMTLSGGNVGIGTNAPTSRLQVKGDGTNPILSLLDGSGTDEVTVLNNGNVGIGTTNPGAKLEVYDNSQSGIKITGTSNWKRILIGNQDSVGANNPAIIQGVNGELDFGNGSTWSGMGGTLQTNMVIKPSGNVGIGTTNPGAKLEVYGSTGEFLSTSNVNHGMTSIVPSDVYGSFGTWSSSAGGLTISGLSEDNTGGLLLEGISGGSPTTYGAIEFRAGKKSGTSGTNLGDSESAYMFKSYNAGTSYLTIKGNGNVGIGTNAPTSRLQVNGTTTAQMIIPESDNTYNLGSSSKRWANLYAVTTTVGDLVFSNDFRFKESAATSTPQSLYLLDASGNAIFRGDDNGNFIIPSGSIGIGIGDREPASRLEINGTTTAQNIMPSSDNMFSLGSANNRWADVYMVNSHVGDLVFKNGFRIIESTSTEQSLIFVNQKGEKVAELNENGNFVVTGKITEEGDATTTASQLAVGENGNRVVNLSPEELKQGLADIGLIVSKNGVLEVEELKARKGVTLYDRATGAPYCLFIQNGEVKTTEGECGAVSQQNSNNNNQDANQQEDIVDRGESSTSTPETLISSHPDASTTSTDAMFEFYATTSDSYSTSSGEITFRCQVNNQGFNPCQSPKKLLNLSPGSYEFKVYAVLPNGKYDKTPASFNWQIVSLGEQNVTGNNASSTSEGDNAGNSTEATSSDAVISSSGTATTSDATTTPDSEEQDSDIATTTDSGGQTENDASSTIETETTDNEATSSDEVASGNAQESENSGQENQNATEN